MQVTFALHNRTGLIVSRHEANMSVHTASALPSAKRLFFPSGLILIVDNFDVDVGVSSEGDYFVVNLRPPFRVEGQGGQVRKLSKVQEEAVARECLTQALGCAHRYRVPASPTSKKKATKTKK